MTDFVESIHPEYTETNFSKHPAIVQLGLADLPEVKLLVMYDSTTGKIYVDERAAEDYKILAAFHEEICQKGLHEEMVPHLHKGDYRCASIEEYIVSQLSPIQAAQYRARRKAMFQFLLDHGLASPELTRSFLNSISSLRRR